MSKRSNSPPVLPVSPHSLFVAIAVMVFLLWVVTITKVSPGRTGEPELNAAKSVPAARLISDLSEIEFGTVRIGERVTRRLLLTNSSLDDTPITVSAVWLSEPDARVFVTDFTSPRTLSAGDSLVIEIGYAPEAAGHQVGALYVSHDGETNLDIYTLSGNGLGPNVGAPDLGEAKPVTEPAFGKSDLAGFSGIKPTSLQFGPDGRLYVADMLGLIKVLEVERKGANDYRVVSEETITLIRDIPNHDDDGKPNAAIRKRLVTGLLVSGTSVNPIVYVASSDPRIGGGPSHTETGLDTNSGVISRLTRMASGQWQKLDLVRGLPRSEENHHINGMALNESTQRLYVGAGGNTNQGGPSNNFAMLPEYALSAAILEIDLGAIGDTTYDLPTLDDETRSGVHDKGDPFGGNDGRNQAKLVPNGPVAVYAPGFRNPYDLVLTDEGHLYTIDNGPNAGWGGPPKGEGAKGNCTNAQSEPGSTYFDSLHLVSGRGYYGGHPNPTRANKSNTFNKTKPQSPVSVANPVECDFRGAGGKAALTTFGFSTNGLAEYRASNFGSAMQGDLLAAAWNNSIQRLVLDGQGTSVTDKEALFANVSGLPLDVTAQDDAQQFPGTIWVADFVKKHIVVFEPVDYKGTVAGVCGGTPSEDDDKDGFSNVDELANGTNPCSPADLPADLDNDFLSDRLDTDDDNDGVSDKNDPFPLDPTNGRGTALPVSYEWENDSEPAGFLYNLGFSGLMSNGLSDYLDLYSLTNMTTGGAAGVLTIDNIGAGDPVASVNNQSYGFQFGVDVAPTDEPFMVHTRLLLPFAGADLGGHQSMGFYIGTGDQDNYIKLVVNASTATGGLQFAAERAGKFEQMANVAAPVLGQSQVDLYLSVDPGELSVRAFYQPGADATLVEVGSATTFPEAWLVADTALAVGIISTSFGGPTFDATWDFLRVTPGSIVSTGSTPEQDPADDGAGSDAVVYAAVNGVIAIEAEHAVENFGAAGRQWVSGSGAGARGNASMVASPDGGLIRFGNSDTPHLRYSVNFPSAGDWHVWVRGWGDAVGNEGKSDSVHVGINGKLSTAKAIQGFPASGWQWSNSQRGGGLAMIRVDSPGQHTIDVWMREDGFELDALLLTLDGSYTPSGQGPDAQQADGVTDSTESGSEAEGDGETVSDVSTGSGSEDGSTSSEDAAGSGNDSDGTESNVAEPDSTVDADANHSSDSLSTVGVTGSWTTVAQTLEDRTESIHVLRDDSLWLFNGFDGEVDIQPSIERYDLAENTWKAVGSTLASPDGAAALTHAGAVMFDDELWVIGGRLGNHPGKVIDRVLIYNFASDKWRYGPTLPGPFAGGGAAIAAGRLHVFGGIDAQANCDVDLHWSIDPANPGNGWQDHWASSPMPLARNHFSTVVLDGLIYALGGQHSHDNCLSRPGQTQTPYVHAYDPADDSWTRLANLPTPQSHAEPSTFVHKGQIWMIGGAVQGDRVVVYDPAADTWKVRNDLKLPEKLLAPAAAIAHGRLFVVAGGGPNVYKPTRATRVIVLPQSDWLDATDNADSSDDAAGNNDGDNNDASEVHTAVDGVIAIEAEHAIENFGAAGRQWVSGSGAGARGNASMVASPDGGLIRFGNDDTPHLRYSVNFPSAGDWYVWVRGWGDAVGNEGKSDSVHVGINGKLSTAKAIQGFPASGWQWSNSQRGGGLAMIQVDSPGPHTIDVWMREDGFELDALILTLDGSYIPSGQGPDAQQADESTGSADTGNEAASDSESNAESGDDTGSEGNVTAVNDDSTDSAADNNTGNSTDEGIDAEKNVIIIETENFSSTIATGSHRWVSGAKEGASGGSMITTPDAGVLRANASDTPAMRYAVDFPAAGTWRVWVRGWGDAVSGEGKSDSVHVGIDGSLAGAKAIQGFPASGWTWSNTLRGGGYASVQVSSPGPHMIDVWMREDGLEVDALVLTTDTAYVPIDLPGTRSDPGSVDAIEGTDDVNIDPDAGTASVFRAPASRNWISFSDSTGSATPRHEAGAVEFGGKLYLMGGRGSRPIDIYDPASNAWSQGAKAPVELHHFQPVVFNEKIWVLGAMTCCYPREDNVGHVWTYTPVTDTWARAMAIPESRQRGSAAAVVRDDKIYLIGGNTLGHDGGAVDWFDEFDPSTGNWRTLPDAPAARDHAQAGLIDNKLVLAAGRRSSQPNVFKDTIAQVDVFDFDSGRWSKGADIPTKRAGTMSVTVGREVLVIGGESAGRQAAHDSVEAYDIDTNDWRLLKPLRQGRHSGGAARLDNAVHVVAGAVTTGGANETASHERLPLD